ncbi:hypothetical protein FLACOL_00151 [Flavobacterium columnare]|uniref:Lipoprotein n=3 Tax=Flavobacterium TaxID=237 RepID=A0ABW8PTK3_9FLAO|nr:MULTISPECIES: hypothetical protein [Flavobacterium]QYS90021.1 hypothetical protein JJC05_07880 [Flavobacterium davisii]SPE76173.1 hypothetical protein FLACOL_00151 [Flavobacterium columnare]
MKQTIFIVLILYLLFVSCKNDKPIADKPTSKPKLEKTNPSPEKTPSVIQEYIPEGFEIQYECDGDLNQDGIKDYAYVLKNSDDDTAPRRTLVFLGNKQKGLDLFMQSDTIFPNSNSEDVMTNFEYEDITISKNELQINFSGLGPSGNYDFIFQFENGELFLKSMESFHAGAGGQTVGYYEVLTGKIEMTQVNTMKEDMPSETEVKEFEPLKLAFDKVNPFELFDQQLSNFESKN